MWRPLFLSFSSASSFFFLSLYSSSAVSPSLFDTIIFFFLDILIACLRLLICPRARNVPAGNKGQPALISSPAFLPVPAFRRRHRVLACDARTWERNPSFWRPRARRVCLPPPRACASRNEAHLPQSSFTAGRKPAARRPPSKRRAPRLVSFQPRLSRLSALPPLSACPSSPAFSPHPLPLLQPPLYRPPWNSTSPQSRSRHPSLPSRSATCVTRSAPSRQPTRSKASSSRVGSSTSA